MRFLPHPVVISDFWSWFPTIWKWFPMFLWSCHSEKKHCGRNRVDQGRPCGTEVALVNLYSTEITRSRSWFLGYTLTRVNSVPHACPWCILYTTHLIRSSLDLDVREWEPPPHPLGKNVASIFPIYFAFIYFWYTRETSTCNSLTDYRIKQYEDN